jgi:membrane protein
MSIKNLYEKGMSFLLKDLWRMDLAEMTRWPKLGLRMLRVISLAFHGFLADRCGLRAAKLTLVFLLSLPPTLAVTFSIAKGFGAQEQLKGMLLGMTEVDKDQTPATVSPSKKIEKAEPDAEVADATPAEPPPSGEVAEPDGKKPDDIKESLQVLLLPVLDYVEKANVATLGFVGLGLLLATSYGLLGTIEKTMNDIWGVRHQRSPVRKLVDYAAVLFVSPILLIVGATVTTSIRVGKIISTDGEGIVSEWFSAFLASPGVTTILGFLVPMAFVIIAFYFLYAFFPNTRVPFKAALAGALATALMLYALIEFFMWMQVGAARAGAIYGTFAAIPILLVMFNCCWLAILFGAELSYAYANQKDIQFGGLSFHPSPAFLQQLAVGVMAQSGNAFQHQRDPLSCAEMALAMGAPVRVMRDVVENLIQANLLVEIHGDVPRFQPARPLDGITLGQILATMRDAGDHSPRTEATLEQLGILRRLKEESAAEVAARGVTLLEMVSEGESLGEDDSVEKPIDLG